MEPSRFSEHAQLGDAPTSSAPRSGIRGLTERAVQSLLRDDSAGKRLVNPQKLNPPAEFEWGSQDPFDGIVTVWVDAPYKKCWKVANPPPFAPPGTAIMCFSGFHKYAIGDGSLEDKSNGHRDNEWAGFNCPLEGSPSFTTLDQVVARQRATRFYDGNADFIEGIRQETFDGTIYNAISGTSARLFLGDTFVYQEIPPDGQVGPNEYQTWLGNDFGVRADGKRIAISDGILSFDPSGNVLMDEGPHPYDNYFLYNEPKGLMPVCNALM